MEEVLTRRERDARFVRTALLVGLALMLADLAGGMLLGYGANPWGLL